MNTKNEQNTEVWVAVLHYQGVENTRACIRSIKKLNYPSFKILITDNCSPGNSGQSLRQEFSDCDYLYLDDNLGFAGGSNASVNYCIDRGAKWIWILNNDTEVDANSLPLLMAAALVDDRVGVLGASVYTPTDNGFHRSGRGEIDFRKAKTFERGEIDDSKDVIECAWISGSNMLLRASAFRELSGFDENFFLYFEDTDLCWRMNQSNWKCLLIPKARVDHIGNASTQGDLAIWRSYYHTRNRLLFFLKTKQGIASLPVILTISAHIMRHMIVLPFRGNRGKRQLRAEILGYSDYFAGKFGKATCLDF